MSDKRIYSWGCDTPSRYPKHGEESEIVIVRTTRRAKVFDAVTGEEYKSVVMINQYDGTLKVYDHDIRQKNLVNCIKLIRAEVRIEWIVEPAPRKESK